MRFTLGVGFSAVRLATERVVQRLAADELVIAGPGRDRGLGTGQGSTLGEGRESSLPLGIGQRGAARRLESGLGVMVAGKYIIFLGNSGYSDENLLQVDFFLLDFFGFGHELLSFHQVVVS